MFFFGSLLEGFISKHDAEKKLMTCNKPTFLLRFSDNSLHSISVVVLKGTVSEYFCLSHKQFARYV